MPVIPASLSLLWGPMTVALAALAALAASHGCAGRIILEIAAACASALAGDLALLFPIHGGEAAT